MFHPNTLTTLLMKKCFLSVWQYIKIKKKKNLYHSYHSWKIKNSVKYLKCLEKGFISAFFSEGNLCGC